MSESLKGVPGPVAVLRVWALASLSPPRSGRARSVVVPYSHLSFECLCARLCATHPTFIFLLGIENTFMR